MLTMEGAWKMMIQKAKFTNSLGTELHIFQEATCQLVGWAKRWTNAATVIELSYNVEVHMRSASQIAIVRLSNGKGEEKRERYRERSRSINHVTECTEFTTFYGNYRVRT